MNPSLPTIDTLYAVGHWLLEQRRPLDAVHVFRTMLMTAPNDERGWLGLGASHEQLGHMHAAVELYQLAEASMRGSFRCSLAQARLLRALDDADGSESAYERAEERARSVDDTTADAIAIERSAA